jgi:hypothetical protein
VVGRGRLEVRAGLLGWRGGGREASLVARDPPSDREGLRSAHAAPPAASRSSWVASRGGGVVDAAAALAAAERDEARPTTSSTSVVTSVVSARRERRERGDRLGREDDLGAVDGTRASGRDVPTPAKSGPCRGKRRPAQDRTNGLPAPEEPAAETAVVDPASVEPRTCAPAECPGR